MIVIIKNKAKYLNIYGGSEAATSSNQLLNFTANQTCFQSIISVFIFCKHRSRILPKNVPPKTKSVYYLNNIIIYCYYYCKM